MTTEQRALVMVRDRRLLDDLDRMAAAAGCELELTAGVTDGRRAWSSAPLVLLDDLALQECTHAGLAKRSGVLVLCHGEPPPAMWRTALGIGADNVLTLPDSESWLVGLLAEAADERPRPTGRVAAVLGGRGGAGASVFAAALALTASHRAGRALLVDCDPLGGGADYLLGTEEVDGLRWPELGVSGGRVAADSLHAALPAVTADGGRLTVLSCGRDAGGAVTGPTADAVAAVVDSGRRAGDVVVCDLPRHLPAASIAALDRAELVVLVVPADVRSCAAATPVVELLRDRGAPVRLVVRGPSPGGLAAVDVSRALSLPLLAAMRPAPGLAAALDTGRLPFRSARNPLAKAATTALDVLIGSAS